MRDIGQISRYLEFLRYSLDTTKPVPDLKGMDWKGLYDFGMKQSIVGVLYQGLQTVKDPSVRPDKYTIIEWFATVRQLHEDNKQLNRDSLKVTYSLYQEAKIKACVLKGQGNALMYPDPFLRTPGDIDLWTNQDTMPLLRFVKNKFPDANIEYHHVDYPIFMKSHVEIHLTPSFMGNLFYEYRLRKYFRTHRAEQFKNLVDVPEETGKICVPTDSFNRIFQLSHVMHHFFFEGVGFRQVIDYYYLLRKGFTDEERREDVATLKHVNMYKFAAGLMWVLHEVLGLDEQYLLMPPNKKVGQLLLDEILKAGNFGFHDDRYNFKGKSLFKQYLLEVYRNLHYAWLFPSETIWGRPISRFWHAAYKWWIRKTLVKG